MNQNESHLNLVAGGNNSLQNDSVETSPKVRAFDKLDEKAKKCILHLCPELIDQVEFVDMSKPNKSSCLVGDRILIDITTYETVHINIHTGNTLYNRGHVTQIITQNDQDGDDSSNEEKEEKQEKKDTNVTPFVQPDVPRKDVFFSYVNRLTRGWEIEKRVSFVSVVHRVYVAHGEQYARARLSEMMRIK